MTGHLKMLQSPSAMNNAEGAASRFPAQASKFICTPLTPTSNPNPTRTVSCGAQGGTSLTLTCSNSILYMFRMISFQFVFYVEEK